MSYSVAILPGGDSARPLRLPAASDEELKRNLDPALDDLESTRFEPSGVVSQSVPISQIGLKHALREEMKIERCWAVLEREPQEARRIHMVAAWVEDDERAARSKDPVEVSDAAFRGIGWQLVEEETRADGIEAFVCKGAVFNRPLNELCSWRALGSDL